MGVSGMCHLPGKLFLSPLVCRRRATGLKHGSHLHQRLVTIKRLRVCAALPVAMHRRILVGHNALLTLAARRANACNCCSFLFAIVIFLPSRH